MSLHSESSYVAQARRQIVERPLRDILVLFLGTREEDQDIAQWSLHDLSPGLGYVAALAVEGHPRLQYWEWSEIGRASCRERVWVVGVACTGARREEDR